MAHEMQCIRGPILNPRADGTVDFVADGALLGDDRGRISFVGPWNRVASQITGEEKCRGIICPAFFDAHIHIPQHPIRGQFMDGVGANPPHGRLLAGLNRNVFPAEARCSDSQYTSETVRSFLADTLAHGVIGGAAYMTVHTAAAAVALEMLPKIWALGPVLMNMNCPEYLRTDAATWRRDCEKLAGDFGRRLIITDRFAVCVDAPLRRQAVQLAHTFDLRMQTHLNEQLAEKRFVEQTLYPAAGSYTDVYDDDGLLDRQPILAHCVRMSPAEFDLVKSKSGTCIAHCPTSNILLGSGIMPLDLVHERGIDYAICTDVGASPTTSLLCEMAQFLVVHPGTSRHATPSQSLFRTTLAAAKILALDRDYGSLEIGKSMTFAEIECDTANLSPLSADEVIRDRLLELPPAADDLQAPLERLRERGLDAGEDLAALELHVQQTMHRLDRKINRVVMDGQLVYESRQNA